MFQEYFLLWIVEQWLSSKHSNVLFSACKFRLNIPEKGVNQINTEFLIWIIVLILIAITACKITAIVCYKEKLNLIFIAGVNKIQILLPIKMPVPVHFQYQPCIQQFSLHIQEPVLQVQVLSFYMAGTSQHKNQRSQVGYLHISIHCLFRNRILFL